MLVELRSLHEKEKNLLMEENKKLSAELEKSLEVGKEEKRIMRLIDELVELASRRVFH